MGRAISLRLALRWFWALALTLLMTVAGAGLPLALYAQGVPSDTPAAEWRRALALMQAQRPRAAQPILERLAAAAPDNPSVQAELGIAYARSGQDARAQAQLARALDVATSDAERRAIQGFLQQIDARSPLSGSFSLGLAPETNVTRRSTLESVTIGDFEFILDETVQSGTGLTADAEVVYAPMIARDLRARTALRFGGRVYENRDLNDYSLRFSTGIEHLGDRGRVLGFGVTGDQRWAGDARFSRDRGIYATFQALTGSDALVFGRVELAQRRVPSLRRRDGTIQRVSFGVSQALRPQTQVTVRGFATRTRANADFESGRLLGVGLGLRHAFESGWQANANLTLSQERRDGVSTAFDAVRRDRTQRLSVAVTNRNYQYRGFSPVLEIGTERRQSNIAINSFRNNFLGLSVTRGF